MKPGFGKRAPERLLPAHARRPVERLGIAKVRKNAPRRVRDDMPALVHGHFSGIPAASRHSFRKHRADPLPGWQAGADPQMCAICRKIGRLIEDTTPGSVLGITNKSGRQSVLVRAHRA